MRPVYTLTTAPAKEPVTIAEAMAALRVDDSGEIPKLQLLLSAAREFVERQTGRALISQQWSMSFEDWPSCKDPYPRRIYIERAPLISVQAVTYFDTDGVEQTLSTDDYRAQSGGADGYGFIELKADSIWPDIEDRADAITIEFTAGHGAASTNIPANIRQTVLLLLAHMYDNPAPVNVGNITTELPFGLRALIDSNRVGGFVA
jgi:uncharacterized phiE125 gp8 family phage protein